MTTISQILNEVSKNYNTWKIGIETAEKQFCYLTKPSFQALRKFIMNTGNLNSDVEIKSLNEMLNEYKIVIYYTPKKIYFFQGQTDGSFDASEIENKNDCGMYFNPIFIDETGQPIERKSTIIYIKVLKNQIEEFENIIKFQPVLMGILASLDEYNIIKNKNIGDIGKYIDKNPFCYATQILNEKELEKKVNEMKTIITNFRTDINNNNKYNYKGPGTVSKIPINTGIYTVGDKNNEKIYKVNINNTDGKPTIRSKIKKGEQQPIEQEGEFNNSGKLIQGIKTIKNKKYDGTFNNYGEFTKGKYFKNNKLIYDGSFLNGEYNGEGELYHEDGKTIKYKGPFLNGKFNGKGTLYYEDGEKSKYEGEFLDDKFNGKGELYDEDGKIKYAGSFKDGNFDDNGFLHLDDYVYIGAFSENKMDGGKHAEYTPHATYTDKLLYKGIFSITIDNDYDDITCKFIKGNIYFKNGDDYISGTANENEKINGGGRYVSDNIESNFVFIDNIPNKLRYLIVPEENNDHIFNSLNKLTKEQREKLFKTLNNINVKQESLKNTFEQLMIQLGVISKKCSPTNIVKNSRSKDDFSKFDDWRTSSLASWATTRQNSPNLGNRAQSRNNSRKNVQVNDFEQFDYSDIHNQNDQQNNNTKNRTTINNNNQLNPNNLMNTVN